MKQSSAKGSKERERERLRELSRGRDVTARTVAKGLAAEAERLHFAKMDRDGYGDYLTSGLDISFEEWRRLNRHGKLPEKACGN